MGRPGPLPQNPDERLRNRISQRLFLGQTRRHIASALGLNLHQYLNTARRLGLDKVPEDYMTVVELESILGFSDWATTDLLQRARVPVRRWGWRRIFLAEYLGRLEQLAQKPLPVYEAIPEGLYTAEQVAKRHGVGVAAFRQRLSHRKTPAAALLKQPGKARLVQLYTLQQFSPVLASPSSPHHIPAGWYTAKQVGAILNLSNRVVLRWGTNGAPTLLATYGNAPRMYIFQLPDLADWLDTAPAELAARGPYRAARLREWMAARQGRAA